MNNVQYKHLWYSDFWKEILEIHYTYHSVVPKYFSSHLHISHQIKKMNIDSSLTSHCEVLGVGSLCCCASAVHWQCLQPAGSDAALSSLWMFALLSCLSVRVSVPFLSSAVSSAGLSYNPGGLIGGRKEEEEEERLLTDWGSCCCECVCLCDDVFGWGLWRQIVYVCVKKREQRGRDISPVAVKFKPPSFLTPWATAALPLRQTHTHTLGHSTHSDGTIWSLTEDWALGSLLLSLRRERVRWIGGHQEKYLERNLDLFIFLLVEKIKNTMVPKYITHSL